ncbi:MAG: cysteine hydrolase family protein [Bryobacteraceae bacterium]
MRRVFFDIDTQIDFVFPAGALYVPGAELLGPAIALLNRYATAHGFPVVSTTCAHSESDTEFRDWPPHCVVGTVGQQKPQGLLLEKGAGQIILEKQKLDLFSNPGLSRLLDELNADSYVVYGVVTEYCVRLAALGLLQTGKPVKLVTDAIKELSLEARESTIREFTAGGGKLAALSEVCGQ